MTAAEMVEHLKELSNPERLTLIEAATRLIQQDIVSSVSHSHEQQERRLEATAARLKDLYEPGGELTEWTSLDGEDVFDDARRG